MERTCVACRQSSTFAYSSNSAATTMLLNTMAAFPCDLRWDVFSQLTFCSVSAHTKCSDVLTLKIATAHKLPRCPSEVFGTFNAAEIRFPTMALRSAWRL